MWTVKTLIQRRSGLCFGIVLLLITVLPEPGLTDVGTEDTLETLVRQAIGEQDAGDNARSGHLAVTFYSRPPGTVDRIGRLQLERRTGRFRVNALYRDERGALKRHAVMGRVVHQVDVPVPVRRIGAGEILSNTDLDIVRYDLSDLPPQAVVDPGDVLGHEARRALLPGRPLEPRMLRAPRLVERNTPVRMIFKKGSLRIEIRGKALEDGGRREVVRVANLESGRVVQAMVVGPDTVTLSFGGARP